MTTAVGAPLPDIVLPRLDGGVLRFGDPRGKRLAKVAAENGMLLMLCDQCANERGLAEGDGSGYCPVGTVPAVQVGCFPDLNAALAANPPDQVITL